MTAPESRDAQSGVEAVLREVLGEHQYGEEMGGTATGSWCPCSCGEQNWINSTRDMAGHKARAHVAAMQAAALGPVIAAERARAVEAVAREWQFGGWTILTPPAQSGAIPALDLGQRVTDWLRERADREQAARATETGIGAPNTPKPATDTSGLLTGRESGGNEEGK